MNTKFYAHRNYGDQIDLRILHGRGFAKPIVFEVVDEGAWTEPAISIDLTAAQQLIDQLWVCGLRPSEGTGSAGSLAATEKHLADMKAIAFGLLKKQGITK